MNEVELFLHYLTADKGYSQKTLSGYQSTLKDFQNFMALKNEGRDWYNVDADLIRQYVAMKMEQGISPVTIAFELSGLRSFYKYLVLTKRTTTNPARLVSGPKKPKRLPAFIKEKELNKLFDGIEFPDNFKGMRDKTILMLLYQTGLRAAELINLNRCDIHTDTGEVKVTGKRNKQRIIPFGEEMKLMLRTYLKARSAQPGIDGQEALFCNEKAERMRYPQLLNTVKAYLSLVTNQKKKVPMCCGTVSQQRCLTTEPNSKPSSNYSDTPASQPPKSTRTPRLRN